MEKSLQVLQVLAKIGRILSKIVWICSLVGAIGCLVGIITVAVGTDEVLKVGGVTIHGIVANESGMNIGSLYASMTVGLILCIGEWILAKYADRYFTHELAAGTPFTFEGAEEMKKLGIRTIVIPIIAMIAANIAYQIINHTFMNVQDAKIDDYASVGLGIAFIILSIVFRYVAHLEQSKTNE